MMFKQFCPNVTPFVPTSTATSGNNLFVSWMHVMFWTWLLEYLFENLCSRNIHTLSNYFLDQSTDVTSESYFPAQAQRVLNS